MHQISAVKQDNEIKTVADLAQRIWNRHFVPIIGQDQVDYMLEKFQSEDTIRSQIISGAEYYIIESDEVPSGYLCLIPDEDSMMISKIYLDHGYRGKGLGRALLDYAVKQARERQLNKIWLTVNRNNDDTIAWYKRRGFAVIDAVNKDIGGGFFMDDYIMEMEVESH